MNLEVVPGHRLAGTREFDGADHQVRSNAGGTMMRVIGLGDTLDGRTVWRAVLGNEALDGDQIVFWADFTDGTSGIYLATVPDPANAVASLLLLALARVQHVSR